MAFGPSIRMVRATFDFNGRKIILLGQLNIICVAK